MRSPSPLAARGHSDHERLYSNAQTGQISAQYYFPIKLCILSDSECQMCGALCFRPVQTVKALLSIEISAAHILRGRHTVNIGVL